MKHSIQAAAFFAAFAAAAQAHAQTADCTPHGWDRARLETLRASEFDIASTRERERFALAIAACVASPDPFLRDQVAFEGLARMLRAERLSARVRNQLTTDMLTRLRGADPQGFEQPFAALVLSELVRADRIAAYYTPERRNEIVAQSVAYLRGVRDYRGYDEREGWRHGVAHGSDLLLQIVINPNFTDESYWEPIAHAVAGQVAPSGHFYIYGESERLARPIIFMAQRGVFTAEEWSGWFSQFTIDTDTMFSSQAGLARRHNTMAFLQTIWLNARISRNEADDALLPGAEAALRALP